MAQPTNTYDSYDAVGQREDLSDFIFNISPTKTPFQSMAQKMTAKAKLHEWQTENLDAVDTGNAVIEGDDTVATAVTPTTRVSNVCQISKKAFLVSGTLEAVDKAGRDSEIAHQKMNKGYELKRDMEAILTGNQASATGSSSVARTLRSMESWYATNVSRAGDGANGSTSAAATDGTQRALTADMILDVQQSAYENGGEPDTLMVSPFHKRQISGLLNSENTREIAAADKKIVGAVDIYFTDFGALKVVPNIFLRGRTAHLLQSDMIGVAYLRPFFSEKLAKTGDSEKYQMLCEYTLCVKNEAAHGVIADLTTS